LRDRSDQKTILVTTERQAKKLSETTSSFRFSPVPCAAGIARERPREGSRNLEVVSERFLNPSTVTEALIKHSDVFAKLALLFPVDLAKTYPGNAEDSHL
jgi:hypothetical protein